MVPDAFRVLSVTVSVPTTSPVEIGANFAPIVHVAWAASGAEMEQVVAALSKVKLGFEILNPLNVIVPLPLFLTVAVRVPSVVSDEFTSLGVTKVRVGGVL